MKITCVGGVTMEVDAFCPECGVLQNEKCGRTKPVSWEEHFEMMKAHRESQDALRKALDEIDALRNQLRPYLERDGYGLGMSEMPWGG